MSKQVKEFQPYYHVLVIGSGGTGTYFLKEFSRFLATAPKSVMDSIGSLTVADGDTVESKNLNRQCFSTDDIGCNKAAAFAEALNDMITDVGNAKLRWIPYCQYITELAQFNDIFTKSKLQNCPYYTNKSEYIAIPVIIGAVDNDACRVLCEQYFEKSDNCYYFDSGNEFSSGECVYAYKIRGKVLSPTKSYYFPCIKTGDLRAVTELSCEELNQSAPQHILTNMVASTQLLSGMMGLFNEEIPYIQRLRLGYSFFDSFTSLMEYTSYEQIKASREAV